MHFPAVVTIVELLVMASGITEGNSVACDASSSNKPLFMDVNADEELETTEVESLCMQCGKSVRVKAAYDSSN